MGSIRSAGILACYPARWLANAGDRVTVASAFYFGSPRWFGLVLTGNGDCSGFPRLGSLCAADDRRAGALPNLTPAPTSEAAGPRFRNFCEPGCIAVFPLKVRWRRHWFPRGKTSMANGVLGRWCGKPLILVPPLMRWPPESAVSLAKNSSRHHCGSIFAPKSETRRCCRWLCYFFTCRVYVDQLPYRYFWWSKDSS